MANRFGKVALSALALSVSVALYGAHQGDLGEQSATAPPLSNELESFSHEGDTLASLVPGSLYETALQRLESRLQRNPGDFEASLLKSLILFKSGLIGEALAEIDALTERAPKFHLAHLIQGDLLLARTAPVADIGASPVLSSLGVTSSDVSLLRDEAEARLQAYLDAIPQGRLPRALLKLDDAVKTAIVVDKAAHRLYVYQRSDRGTPTLIEDYYVSTGKLTGNKNLSGDLRTPEGVYFVTRYIPDEELPDKYGIGAYPINYPNELDQLVGKTGYGIWLHGTDADSYSRPPLDSEGCVVLPNLDLRQAERYIDTGITPVIIAESVTWLEPSVWQQQRRELLKVIEQWRVDWASLDAERYFSHYSQDYQNLEAWKAYKRRVFAGKTRQDIDLQDISVYLYPEREDDTRRIAVVNLFQRYDSNNFSSEMDKRLYLVEEEGRWKILLEGRR